MTRDRRISLVNIGSFADDLLQALVPILEGVFKADIDITDEVPLPRSAYNASTPDRDRFVHRAVTEAVHELGHTYGLNHCDDPHCVMWFSNTLAETDRKGTEFCATHLRALQRTWNRFAADMEA